MVILVKKKNSDRLFPTSINLTDVLLCGDSGFRVEKCDFILMFFKQLP